MWKKVLPLIGVVMAIMLTLVPPVSAESLQSEGRLTAQGDGIAILWGRGTVDVSGNGILWVYDRAGDAIIRVTGEGQKKEFPDGWVQYAGFHGTAHVEGSRVVVIVAGVEVELTAQGRGRAWLWGHGSHQSSAGSGQWRSRPDTRIGLAIPW